MRLPFPKAQVYPNLHAAWHPGWTVSPGRPEAQRPGPGVSPQAYGSEACQRMCRLRYPDDLNAQIACFERFCWK